MKLTLPKLIRLNSATMCALGGLAVGLRAQTPPPADSTVTTTTTTTTRSAGSSDDVTTLEKFTVSDVPLTEQVLPTVRPIGDVMGDATSIIDIPRSVSSVNEAWMKDRMVKNAMDFGQFAPGVYSAAQYGIPAVPFIRGDLSQIYVDGQVALFSRNSTPPSFNGVEALDIVKGPGSAVYGPQGEGAGGYVDFVMKQPYFDTFHGEVDATFGYWTSGHSYSNPEFTLDVGGPLSDKSAYRISYLERFGDGYYENLHNSTQDLYGAYTFKPTKDLKFDFWAQMYSDRTNENTGVNRVTQQFIDHGTYVAGPASVPTTGPNAFYGYDIATPGAPIGSYGDFTDGGLQTVTSATAHTVKLPDWAALIGPSDTARSKLFQAQLKTTLDLTADSFLVDRAYFSLGRSDKFETYGYDEYVPRQDSIQDRLEYHAVITSGAITQHLIAGLDFRYSGLTSYQDFTTEPFSQYDLSQSASQIFYPGYYLEGKTFGGGASIPGAPGFSANSEAVDSGGSSGNQISNIYDSALFVQDAIQLTDKLTLTPGYRLDYINASDESPAVIENGYYAYYTYYPLVTPIYIPKGHSSPYIISENGITESSYYGFNDSDNKTDNSFFVSLAYKLTETSSVYATYDRVLAVLGSSNFGGLDVNPTPDSGAPGFSQATVNAQPQKDKTELSNALSALSTLYEIGFKTSLLHNTLYFGAAGFQQTKLGVQIGGATDMIKDQGVELDAVYQPSKAWTINGNVTYQNATVFGSSFFQETGNYLDTYNTNTIVDGKPGTGLGSPNFTSYKPTSGRMRAPGIPQAQANLFAVYTDPSGWGGGIGPQIQGREYANDQETLHIPTEIEWDGYLFYGTKTWDVRVNVKNILNTRLLDPIDVSFAGNDTVYVRPPISASLSFRYHF